MLKKLLGSVQFHPENIVEKLKENVSLVLLNNKKFILKSRREENIVLDHFKFQNEKRFYAGCSKYSFTSLNIPHSALEQDQKGLLLEYIEKSKSHSTDLEEFTKAY